MLENKPSSDEIKSDIKKYISRLEAIQSRRDTILEMIEMHHDFNKEVQDVLVAGRLGRIPGVCGTLADLMQVSREEEIIVGSILGEAVQLVVTETTTDALHTINYLKSRKSRIVNIAPLDRLCGSRLSEEDKQSARQAKGYVGLIIDSVSCDSKYAELINSLLGDVIIAEDLTSADKIWSKMKRQYRVATINGELIDRNGIISGVSSPSLYSRILSRPRLKAELDQEILDVEERIAELKIRLRELRNS